MWSLTVGVDEYFLLLDVPIIPAFNFNLAFMEGSVVGIYVSEEVT